MAEKIPVTVDNFIRAETDWALDGTIRQHGAFGKFTHIREVAPFDKQPELGSGCGAPLASPSRVMVGTLAFPGGHYSNRIFSNDRGRPYCLLVKAGIDFDVSRIFEEAFFRGAIRKLDHKYAIDVVTPFSLEGPGNFEVVSKSGSGPFK